jgi:hypothetical protein
VFWKERVLSGPELGRHSEPTARQPICSESAAQSIV